MAVTNSEFKRLLEETAGDDDKPKKQVNDNLMITGGITTQGINFNLKWKNLVKKGGLTTLGLQKNEYGMMRYYFTQQVPLLIHEDFCPSILKTSEGEMQELQSTFFWEIDSKHTKFHSREQVTAVDLGAEGSPWKLRFEQALRTNVILPCQSRKFLREESMPSIKHSVGLEYTQGTQSSFTRISAEFAMPLSNSGRSPSYARLEARHQQAFPIIQDKIQLVTDFQAGKLLGARTFVNDRFFLFNSMGFQHLGHSYPTNQIRQQPPTQNSRAEIILGDDLGVDEFMYASFRLDYKNVPLIKQIGARVFTSAEFAYYPSEKGDKIPVRSSLNMGVNFPLGQINISLYHTIATFGFRRGDIQKSGALNFSFQFF